MKHAFTWDNVLHVLGGAALAMLLLPAYRWHWLLPFGAALAWGAGGLMREVAQAGSWERVRYSPHKIAEGLAWGVGAFLGLGLPLVTCY